MSTQYAFGKIVTNGLVLSLDAADKNSYVGSGTVWNDLSGNNNSGSLVNQTVFNSANGGNMVFDGVDDYVNVSHSSTLAITGNMSILAWIKLTDYSTYNGIAGKTNSNIAAPYDLYTVQTGDIDPVGRLRFYRGNGTLNAAALSSTSVPTGSWQHITVTMSSTLVNFYINANRAGSATLSTTIGDAGKSLRIGNRDDLVTDMKGSIANVQLYNRALSISEILQNYNTQKGRFGLT